MVNNAKSFAGGFLQSFGAILGQSLMEKAREKRQGVAAAAERENDLAWDIYRTGVMAGVPGSPEYTRATKAAGGVEGGPSIPTVYNLAAQFDALDPDVFDDAADPRFGDLAGYILAGIQIEEMDDLTDTERGAVIEAQSSYTAVRQATKGKDLGGLTPAQYVLSELEAAATTVAGYEQTKDQMLLPGEAELAPVRAAYSVLNRYGIKDPSQLASRRAVYERMDELENYLAARKGVRTRPGVSRETDEEEYNIDAPPEMNFEPTRPIAANYGGAGPPPSMTSPSRAVAIYGAAVGARVGGSAPDGSPIYTPGLTSPDLAFPSVPGLQDPPDPDLAMMQRYEAVSMAVAKGKTDPSSLTQAEIQLLHAHRRLWGVMIDPVLQQLEEQQRSFAVEQSRQSILEGLQSIGKQQFPRIPDR